MKESYVPVKVDGLEELIKLLDQASQQAKQLDKTLKKIQKQKLIIKS